MGYPFVYVVHWDRPRAHIIWRDLDVPYTLVLMTEDMNEKSANSVADPGGMAEFGGAREDISRICDSGCFSRALQVVAIG